MRSARHKAANIGVANGDWGEDVAAEFLRRGGYTIVERNVQPVAKDRRLEIDIVAFDRSCDTMVFVEVKQHAEYSPYARRLRSIDRNKRSNLRRACNAWRRVNKWHGAYRFDVIEIFGPPGKKPYIDHIERVALFPKKERYVKWN